jgi:uncharacterized phage-associated protein
MTRATLQSQLRTLRAQHISLLSMCDTWQHDPVAVAAYEDAARTKAYEIAECEVQLRSFTIPPIPTCAVIDLAAVREMRRQA